jgi:hypothetical protein
VRARPLRPGVRDAVCKRSRNHLFRIICLHNALRQVSPSPQAKLMLSLRGARAGGMLGTGARVGAVMTLGVLLASVVIDGARPTPQWLCDKLMEAIAMEDTMDVDEFECKGVRPARPRPD